MSCHCKNLVDVSALGGVHTLDLSRCDSLVDVSALGGVHSLYTGGRYRVGLSKNESCQ